MERVKTYSVKGGMTGFPDELILVEHRDKKVASQALAEYEENPYYINLCIEERDTSNTDIMCSDCGRIMRLRVCQSAAGYYPGYWCDECGPWSRESEGYYKTSEKAQKEVDRINSLYNELD